MHVLAHFFGRSAMVVKGVHIDETAETQVMVVARKAGLISWILSLLGIDSTYTLWFYRDRIESMEGSLSGRIKTLIPLSSLDTFTSGFTKPILLFVFSALLLAFALFYCFIVCFIDKSIPALVIFIPFVLSVICFVFYRLRKCLLLAFTTNGANGIYFLFKRSIIEGVNIDESIAERIAGIIKENYIAQMRK